ncbi:FISUMP domain-containing protein [Ancylomarina sp. YFZ004]
MKTNSFFNVLLFLSLSILLSNCSKEDSNEAPQLVITSPADGTEIIIGPLVTIKTEAIDNDGSIREVQFFINNHETALVRSPPFEMILDTKNLSEGLHVLKVVAKDNQNKSTTVESQIELSLNFTPGHDFFDARDGNIYKTVIIGEQCWMSQNLKFKTDEGSWYYENNEIIGETYGCLYSMETALKVSPEGWHLPTDNEWKILEGTVDSEYKVNDEEWNKDNYRGSDIGLNLKSKDKWIEKGNGIDKFGFNAIPSGYKYNQTSFDNFGFSAFYWTSSFIPTGNYLITREIFSPLNTCHRTFERTYALAIRCVQD